MKLSKDEESVLYLLDCDMAFNPEDVVEHLRPSFKTLEEKGLIIRGFALTKKGSDHRDKKIDTV